MHRRAKVDLFGDNDFEVAFEPGDTMVNISMGYGNDMLEMMMVDFNRMNKGQKGTFIKSFAGHAHDYLKDIYGDMTATTKIINDLIKQMQQPKIVTTEDIAKVVNYYKTKGSNMMKDTQYREFNKDNRLNRTERLSQTSIYNGLFQSFKSAGQQAVKK